jgi:hypothetical protein
LSSALLLLAMTSLLQFRNCFDILSWISKHVVAGFVFSNWVFIIILSELTAEVVSDGRVVKFDVVGGLNRKDKVDLQQVLCFLNTEFLLKRFLRNASWQSQQLQCSSEGPPPKV